MKFETYNLSLKERLKKQIKQFKKYCYISVASGVLMFTLLFLFTSLLNIYYLLSLTMAYTITVTGNFILNKIFIFNRFHPESLSKQYSQFFIVSFSGFIGNFIALYVLVSYFKWGYLFAQLLISAVGLPLLFFCYRNLVFSFR